MLSTAGSPDLKEEDGCDINTGDGLLYAATRNKFAIFNTCAEGEEDVAFTGSLYQHEQERAACDLQNPTIQRMPQD